MRNPPYPPFSNKGGVKILMGTGKFFYLPFNWALKELILDEPAFASTNPEDLIRSVRGCVAALVVIVRAG